MKNKKIVLLLCAASMLILLSSCGSDQSGDKNDKENESKVVSDTSKEDNSDEMSFENNDTTDSKVPEDNKGVKIEDIDWKIYEGVVDGERYVLASLKNNSNYDICEFEIKFKEKENLSNNDKAAFYSDISEKLELDSDEKKELEDQTISMRCENEIPVSSGDTIDSMYCYYYDGSYFVKDIKHYDLVEPDIATIKYIDGEKISTEYYDFVSGEYSFEEEQDVAYYWTETELGKKIPKPNVKIVKVGGRDDDDMFIFHAYGMTLEQFNEYVDSCKAMGYTENETSHEGFYTADDAEGYNVYLFYKDYNCVMDATFQVPEE